MRIRSARDGDYESIVRLYYHVREVSMPYLPTVHTLEEALTGFPKILRERQVLVAEHDDTVIGYAAFRTGWVDHLYVHPAYQRQGIGSALLQRAMRVTASLRLWVFQRNAGARAFYERRGFKLVRFTDGAGNEEHEPDALYEWQA